MFLVLLALWLPTVSSFSCKGLRGQNVDWFIAYKMPSGLKIPDSGRAFYYLDDKTTNWTLAKSPIGDVKQPIGATISQVYEAGKETFSFMYSDDGPNSKVDSYRGHAKGVVLFDTKKGFWMVHSVPNFPPTKSFSYPDTAAKYGQSFLCVTLPTNSLSDVGEHLRFIQATPFQSNLPDSFATKFPVLRNIVNKQSLPPSASVFTSVHQLRTPSGMSLLSYAKHKKFGKDLWIDLIAKEARSNLAVQSWLNGGADDVKSQCQRDYSVYDVETISVGGNQFNSSRCHSKWAVGDSQNVPIVCVGDMNRQTSQFRRGGGAVCLFSFDLWQTFRASVIRVEPCAPNGKNRIIYSLCFIIFSFFIR